MKMIRVFLKSRRAVSASAHLFRSLLQPVIFDEGYYIHRHLHGKRPFYGAWLHFVFLGSWRGYDPHPCFDSVYYSKMLGKELRNPYFHYLSWGYRRRYSPTPLLDALFYDEHRSPDQVIPGQSQLEHYLTVGVE